MGIQEYLDSIETVNVDSELISSIEREYDAELTEYVKKIISFDANGYFFGECKRLLSANEILTADEELHVNFKELKMIPIFDIGDINAIREDEKNNCAQRSAFLWVAESNFFCIYNGYRASFSRRRHYVEEFF